MKERIFYVSFEDINAVDLFTKAKDKGDAVDNILRYIKNQIKDLIQDITNDEDIEEWKDLKEGEVINEI